MDEILVGPGRSADGFQIALLLDGELGNRLASLADAVGDALRPARLNADHHNRVDVGVGACADDGAEM